MKAKPRRGDRDRQRYHVRPRKGATPIFLPRADPYSHASDRFDLRLSVRSKPAHPRENASQLELDGDSYVRRYSSGSLTTGGSSSRSSSSSPSSSSSSSWLGSRGGHVLSVMATRLQSAIGDAWVMSAPVWMLRRSPPTQRELRHRQSCRRHYDARTWRSRI